MQALTCTITGNGTNKSCTISGALALTANDFRAARDENKPGSAALRHDCRSAERRSPHPGTAVATTQANDDIVRMYGTGSNFAAGNGLGITYSGSGAATGADDGVQAGRDVPEPSLDAVIGARGRPVSGVRDPEPVPGGERRRAGAVHAHDVVVCLRRRHGGPRVR